MCAAPGSTSWTEDDDAGVRYFSGIATYGKVIRVSKRYKAHDETNACMLGDEVRIVESRSYSKDKHWRVEEILQRAEQIDTSPLQAE